MTTNSKWPRLAIILVYSITFLLFLSKILSDCSTPTNLIPLTSTDSELFVTVSFEEIMSGDPIELSQIDPRIKKYIWDNKYMMNPSSESYNLQQPDINPSMGQGQIIQKLFNNMEGGFFVESGALDGETRSNTLYLEKTLGWKGLLVEPSPSNYASVLAKNRKAWTSMTCMATKPYPHKVVFKPNFNIGKIESDSSKDFKNQSGKTSKLVVAQCFPLFSLLNALSVSTIDYFSLDVEGTEMELLQNIPFDKIFIKTLSVEFNHINKGKDALKAFMEDKGYISVAEVTNSQGLANDFIFVHNSLKNLIEEAKKFKIDDVKIPSTSKLVISSLQ